MNFCPEDQLLILCARTDINNQNIKKISQLLTSNLGWDYLVRASIQHSTTLLLYNALRVVTDKFNPQNQNSAHIPETTKTQLETIYLNNQPRTERMHKVMAELFRTFQQQNIDIMVLKELGMIQFAYPEVNLHPIGDLDLLIHKENYPQAKAALINLGYRPLPADDCYYQLTYDAQYQYQRPTDNIWLDIQWDIENKETDVYGEGFLNFGVERMWKNARPIQIDNCNTLMPSPTDLLFHLCLHLEGHGYTELILLTDVAEAIKAYGDDLNWDELLALAQQYGVEATVYYVLLWVKVMFDTSIPDQVFENLTPPYLKAYFFNALFGNLIPLHTYLDEITLVTAPPDEVMHQYERIVRRQAVGAMHVYQAVDESILKFKANGGQLALLNGETSSVVFPSTTLPTFNPLQLIIFEQDLPLLKQTVAEQGFQQQDNTFHKRIAIQSTEPTLANHPFNLTITWKIQKDNQNLFEPDWPAALSKKDTAIRIIRGAMGSNQSINLDIKLFIEIYPIKKPEEILAYLCLKAADEESKLLAGCYFSEFFRIYGGQGQAIDWKSFLDIVNAHQADSIESIYNSLVVAYQLAARPEKAIIEAGLSYLQETFSPKDLKTQQSPLFAQARYGPDLLNTADVFFKNSFFILLTFLSISQTKTKLSYIWRFIFSGKNGKESLFNFKQFVVDLIMLVVHTLRRPKENQTHSPTDFVYWIE